LTFRKGTQQLYSASFDRSIKLFDLSVLAYVETLFGHQDPVLSLDALRGETAVSVGGMDKTVRYWKITEESQLVFRGGGRSAIKELMDGALEGMGEEGDQAMQDGDLGNPQDQKGRVKSFVEGSIECVAMIDETTFVSGGDSG
jgi:ribosomal RNA-processing protein 9